MDCAIHDDECSNTSWSTLIFSDASVSDNDDNFSIETMASSDLAAENSSNTTSSIDIANALKMSSSKGAMLSMPVQKQDCTTNCLRPKQQINTSDQTITISDTDDDGIQSKQPAEEQAEAMAIDEDNNRPLKEPPAQTNQSISPAGEGLSDEEYEKIRPTRPSTMRVKSINDDDDYEEDDAIVFSIIGPTNTASLADASKSDNDENFSIETMAPSDLAAENSSNATSPIDISNESIQSAGTQYESDGESEKTASTKTIVKTHKRLHACHQCDEVFGGKSNLKEHQIAVHQENRPYPCQICKKWFFKRYALNIHMRTHTRESPDKCDQCDKVFRDKSNLIRHQMAVHDKIRSFSCDICDKRFTKSSNLKRHSMVHTGQKPFACDVCEMSFTRKFVLNRHKTVVHDGLRLHICDQCDKKFSHKSNLKVHKLTVHQGMRPFACLTCEKYFSKKYDLKRHSMAHTGQKPFACAVCEMSFTRKSSLNRHNTSACNPPGFAKH